MESVLSPTDKQSMISSFLEIAVGQTDDTARQFLQATSWKLEEAIQLFYIGNESGGIGGQSNPSPADGGNAVWADENAGVSGNENGKENIGQHDGDEVRPPLPVRREVLYDDAVLYPALGMGSHESSSLIAFRNFDEEMKRPGVWESDQGSTSTAENARDNLASLYRPPFHLMYRGSFEKAKAAASLQDKWLLVNLQSTKEFSSHMLNRDTWANEAVSQTISTNFIFWQNLLLFLEGGPKDHHVSSSHKRPREKSATPPQKLKDEMPKEEDEELQAALAASLENVDEPIKTTSEYDKTNTSKEEEAFTRKIPAYPPLPEEPNGDRSLLCRVGVRLPDGRRVQRNFLRTDPIQLLWSFCCSQLEEAESRPFRLAQAIPGASKSLDYDSKLTFQESGLANSMISLTWE
ncbi:plant UBX domain-containing protein 7 isoform X5 [Syzygium oleosum]|uniref:plant UBX domain-containing protein 7 isoform X5 n=1 Tax=Syzygium oleosum TaxID=219896 RepID=UPI0024B97FAE|nr:plant UBX domain-containing protein 7 isoform X5 [Syzygium oleosum]